MILFSMFSRISSHGTPGFGGCKSGAGVGHSLGIFFGFGNECLWYRVVFVGRTRYLQWGNLVCGVQFFGARSTSVRGLFVRRSVRWSVGPLIGRSVGR